MSLSYPTLNAFGRREAAERRPATDAWTAAAEAIDFGCAVFAAHTAVRKECPTRDIVMAALLRRALVVSEGIHQALRARLVEAAMPLLRTLLDIEVNARLVTADPTENTAKRLAAYHYMAVKRHQERQLGDAELRTTIAEFEAGLEGAKEIARNNKQWFEAPGFDEVRSQVVPGLPWHGYSSAADAYAAVGMTADYLQSYDTGTMFSHAANVDFDFDAIIEGRVMLKGLLTNHEGQVRSVLGGAVVHLLQIVKLMATDKPLAGLELSGTVDGESLEPAVVIDSLIVQLLAHFPASRQRDSASAGA